MSERSLRLLFTASPAYGHLLPMLPLMRAALRAGHDVRVATGPDMVGTMARRGLRAYAAGPTFAQMQATRDEQLAGLEDAQETAQIAASVRGLFGFPARERLAGLRELVQDWRPDLVVHEPLEFAGALLARSLDVPSVTHGFGPMFLEYDLLARPAAEGAGDPSIWEYIRGQACLDICPPSLRPPGDAVWPSALSLRPSPGEAGDPTYDAVLSGLSGSRLAYVTLGTVTNTAPGELATAVEAVRDLPLDVVVTTGPGQGTDVLGAQPDNVRVAEFIPQATVLERASLMVSQCGAGTMLGALCAGIPQVCVPRGADQPLNAVAVERSGAAVVVPPEKFSADAVRAAVERVLSQPSYAEAALRVRDEIRAMPDADDVLPELLRITVGTPARS